MSTRCSIQYVWWKVRTKEHRSCCVPADAILNNGEKLPSWVKKWRIFLGNTGSTNKDAYFMGWGMKMVQCHLIEYSYFSFLIVGHKKCDLDRIFLISAKAYNTSDVFSSQELLRHVHTAPKIEPHSNWFETGSRQCALIAFTLHFSCNRISMLRGRLRMSRDCHASAHCYSPSEKWQFHHR